MSKKKKACETCNLVRCKHKKRNEVALSKCKSCGLVRCLRHGTCHKCKALVIVQLMELKFDSSNPYPMSEYNVLWDEVQEILGKDGE